MTVSIQQTHDIIEIIRGQLPRVLRNKLSIKVLSDPYHLRSIVYFKDDLGREFECRLEEELIGTRVLALKIPDEFLAHLCAVV